MDKDRGQSEPLKKDNRLNISTDVVVNETIWAKVHRRILRRFGDLGFNCSYQSVSRVMLVSAFHNNYLPYVLWVYEYNAQYVLYVY